MTPSELLPKNEDVLLSCAFIPDVEKRAGVLGLYSFLETLRDIPERVSDPLMGEIRLRWWYEAIEEIEAKRTPRYHPLTEVLQTLIETQGLDPKVFYDLIEGQMPLLDKGPMTIKEALSVVDRGEGIVARLAAEILATDGDLTDVVRFYGLARIKAQRGLSDAGEAELTHLLREARKAAKLLPMQLMPLALPASLAQALWRNRPLGPLAKRIKLFWSFITGRIS